MQQHSPQASSDKRIKRTLIILLVAVMLIGAGSFLYLGSKVSDLEQRNNELAAQTDTETTPDNKDEAIPLNQPQVKHSQTTNNPDREVITGQARQEGVGEVVQIICYVYGNSVDELWLHYGNTLAPQQQTARITEVIGENEEKVYGGAIATIAGEKLEAGTIYTYRCAGSVNGTTVLGGIASFTTLR